MKMDNKNLFPKAGLPGSVKKATDAIKSLSHKQVTQMGKTPKEPKK